MNPLFMGTNSMMSKMQQVMSEYQKIKQNPDRLGKLLYDNHKIDKTQLEEISKYGGNYQSIGQYLINSGNINKQNAEQFFNK